MALLVSLHDRPRGRVNASKKNWDTPGECPHLAPPGSHQQQLRQCPALCTIRLPQNSPAFASAPPLHPPQLIHPLPAPHPLHHQTPSPGASPPPAPTHG
eukprot:361462-Chlamydomonas_euryale.AAC.2